MGDRLALRFVSRCQTVDQFARVFCPHAQADRLSVPLAVEPPPVGTRLRAVVALANKLGVIEGEAEIGELVGGAVQLRFLALDPRSRGFLAHLVAHRGLDPAPVPRHLVPMGAAVAGGPTTADPSLGACLIEPFAGSGPVPQVDINATTRTGAAPPAAARRELPPIAARAPRREAPTVPGVAGGPSLAPAAPPLRAGRGSGGGVPAAVDDGMTAPIAAPAFRRAPDAGRPIDDLATDIVPALHDDDQSDPAIDPPPPAPYAPPPYAMMQGAAPAGYPPPAMAPMAHAMAPPPMAHAMAPPPMAPQAMAPQAMAPPPAAPKAMTPPQSMPPLAHPPVAPAPAPMLSPATVGSAVAGPASAASWPMPAQPAGWAPAAPPRAPAAGGYPTAQLPALGYDGPAGPRRAGMRDRRRPVEMEGDPDLTEIVNVPRRVPRARNRRWPVIVATSLVVVVIVVIAIIASRTSGDDEPEAPPPTAPTAPTAPAGAPSTSPPPAPPPAAAGPGSTDTPAAAPAPAAPGTEAPAPTGEPGSPTATATAAAAAEPCTVTFTSSPDGADVTVDGKPLGATPVTVEVPCGPLTATFKRDRYKVERVSVEARPGPQTVRARLDRQSFKVKVTSSPSGASITVGGAAAGKTPATVTVPGYENVTIEVTRAGHAPMSRKVYATHGGETVDFRLRKKH